MVRPDFPKRHGVVVPEVELEENLTQSLGGPGQLLGDVREARVHDHAAT
jgi:hypothetical protein